MNETDKSNRPFVFVRCLTYNHEPYIEDALKGFVIQKTDFPVVVAIVNDASPDKTADVIKRFISKNCNSEDISYKQTSYADIIMARPISNANCLLYVLNLYENHFQKKSHRTYYKQFTDKATYWAECEGDDYWTDPYKLKKQVDYMESHPECIMCVHAAKWTIGENEDKIVRGCNYQEERDLTTDEIILNGGLYIAWASTILKAHTFPDGDERPIWWQMADVGDYPERIYASLNGKVHFLPDVMCVYRFQHPGSWTYNQGKTKDIKHAKCEIAWLEVLDKGTQGKYSDAIYRHLYNYFNLLFFEKEISIKEYYNKVCRTGVISRQKLIKQVIQRIFSHSYKVYCQLRYKN